jgi:hypothetical protein
MKTRALVAALAVAAALAVPATALSANEVTRWNSVAQTTILAQPPITSAPPAAAVFMAMVQGAVYGAVNAIDRHGRPYLLMARADKDASLEAAVATAAYRVLDTLFPAQHGTLTTEYANSLAAITATPAGKQKGIAVGEAAAAAMLAEGHDGRTVLPCTFGAGPGDWQPWLGVCDPSPWVANAVPFLVSSASQFRTAGPLPLDSAAYAADLNEVKSIGALNSATRTAAQTHVAAFWQTSPTANYNALARRFVDALGLDVSESARMFAQMDLSAADSAINTWNDKYYWNFWRPVFAIRNADLDGNPATEKDATWLPMFDPSLPAAVGGVGPPLVTAPYPEHPSGAIGYASASLNALAAFLGTDEISFFLTSSRFPGEQRTFMSFSSVLAELVEARIWAGIHFRTADVQARQLGEEVARWNATHYFASSH